MEENILLLCSRISSTISRCPEHYSRIQSRPHPSPSWAPCAACGGLSPRAMCYATQQGDGAGTRWMGQLVRSQSSYGRPEAMQQTTRSTSGNLIARHVNQTRGLSRRSSRSTL